MFQLSFIVVDANALAVYVLGAAGLLQSLMNWADWAFF